MRVTVGNTVTFCMTLSQVLPIWKEAPFIRLLLPFSGGILLQQNLDLPPFSILLILGSLLFVLLLLRLTSLFFKYRFNWLAGMLINALLICTGWLICYSHDEAKDKDSILAQYTVGKPIQIILTEPLVEKQRSYKAIASVEYLLRNDTLVKAKGKLIVYFPKDSISQALGYGSAIVFSKPLELIRNSGNPGAFDYELYCQRQGIYYSVYLNHDDYRSLPGTRQTPLKKLLLASRQRVLDILSLYIKGERESGFAKALLIGYKDDLDKNLVRAYSNTGVVHIIAISGLHLGIIFWLLSLVVRPMQNKFHSRWPGTIVIILGLWLFSLVAGAGPSVLRSAFMFSVIVLGKAMSKNANVYNNLSFSALALLCINPYWLWDAGFQLSYSAVLSIVIFFKPIYNWYFFRNRIVDSIWKLSAVTIAAQVLTLPISLYHFHQLPVYFLFSNLVAVPWSSLVLIGEILLCCFSFFPAIASVIGIALEWTIQFLNTYVGNINQLPFAVWDQLQISFLQMLLLFGMVACLSFWIIYKQSKWLTIGLCCLLVFGGIRAYFFNIADRQLKLIVYNIQNASAMDFIDGRESLFEGDVALLNNPFIQDFSLKPSRRLNRVQVVHQLDGLLKSKNLFQFGGKNILTIDKSFHLPKENLSIDILILSKNPGIHLRSLTEKIHPGLIIADASDHVRKSAEWKRESETLGIAFHDVRSEGAYVLSFK